MIVFVVMVVVWVVVVEAAAAAVIIVIIGIIIFKELFENVESRNIVALNKDTNFYHCI